MDFAIRRTNVEEIDEVMRIYAHARAFMAEQGNPDQWGPTSWPPRELVEKDVAEGKSHVAVTHEGRIAAVFYYDFGRDVDPCYLRIEDGAWASGSPYGVVHRIASAHVAPGAGTACLTWALDKDPHVRIDTHANNIPLRRLIAKLGFSHRGTIYVQEDDMPRMAFEHV